MRVRHNVQAFKALSGDAKAGMRNNKVLRDELAVQNTGEVSNMTSFLAHTSTPFTAYEIVVHVSLIGVFVFVKIVLADSESYRAFLSVRFEQISSLCFSCRQLFRARLRKVPVLKALLLTCMGAWQQADASRGRVCAWIPREVCRRELSVM